MVTPSHFTVLISAMVTPSQFILHAFEKGVLKIQLGKDSTTCPILYEGSFNWDLLTKVTAY